MTNLTSINTLIDTKAHQAFLNWYKVSDNDDAKQQFLSRYKGSFASRNAYTKEFYGSDCNVDVLPTWIQDNINYRSLTGNLFSDTVLGIAWCDSDQTPLCECTDPEYCDHERDYYDEEGVYIVSSK